MIRKEGLESKQKAANSTKAAGVAEGPSKPQRGTTLDNAITFDNRVLKALPIDTIQRTESVRSIPGVCFSVVSPTPVNRPELVAISFNALKLIGLDEALVLNEAGLAAEYFSGNKLFIGSEPAAHCYCGHQFGSFAGQLGDGAAMYLGEAVVEVQPPVQPISSSSSGPAPTWTLGSPLLEYLTKVVPDLRGATPDNQPSGGSGEPTVRSGKGKELVEPATSTLTQRSYWELQLKGAGPTPYSRSADGRKVLRSSIREFLCSEHMFALGIPTTRAATLVTSDSVVERDPLYSGRIIQERCTIISRVAQTFFRFGSFQVCDPVDPLTGVGGPSSEDLSVLHKLFAFTIRTYFPHLVPASPSGSTQSAPEVTVLPDPVLTNDVVVAFLRDVTRRTARLIALWQAFGFVHGVMNTDNMSILGLTIDYGPYAFMTQYDENLISNQSDSGGRYAYAAQPENAKWNLLQLAQSLSLLFVPLDASNSNSAVTSPRQGSRPNATPKASTLFTQEEAGKALFNVIEEEFDATFDQLSQTLFRRKLGIVTDNWSASNVKVLRNQFYAALQDTRADWTETHRALGMLKLIPQSQQSHLTAAQRKAEVDQLIEIIAEKIVRTCPDPQTVKKQLQNKLRTMRSHTSPQQVVALLQLHENEPEQFKQLFRVPPEVVVEQLKGELVKFQKMNEYLKQVNEWDELDAEAAKTRATATWVEFLYFYYGLLMQYQSPEVSDGLLERQRQDAMRRTNPCFVLRPWVLQEVIEKAEKGNYSIVQELLDRAVKPFEEDTRDGVLWGSHLAPPEAVNIRVSCSS